MAPRMHLKPQSEGDRLGEGKRNKYSNGTVRADFVALKSTIDKGALTPSRAGCTVPDAVPDAVPHAS